MPSRANFEPICVRPHSPPTPPAPRYDPGRTLSVTATSTSARACQNRDLRWVRARDGKQGRARALRTRSAHPPDRARAAWRAAVGQGRPRGAASKLPFWRIVRIARRNRMIGTFLGLPVCGRHWSSRPWQPPQVVCGRAGTFGSAAARKTFALRAFNIVAARDAAASGRRSTVGNSG